MVDHAEAAGEKFFLPQLHDSVHLSPRERALLTGGDGALNGKKSFLLYFDAEEMVNALPPAQRGELFSALFGYARAAAEGQMDMELFLQSRPELGPEGAMAFRFLAVTIRRDTERWLQTQARRQSAAQNQWRQREEAVASPSPGRGARASGRPAGAQEEVLARYVRELHRQRGEPEA